MQDRFEYTQQTITVYAVKMKMVQHFSLYIIEDMDNGNGKMQIGLFLQSSKNYTFHWLLDLKSQDKSVVSCTKNTNERIQMLQCDVNILVVEMGNLNCFLNKRGEI